MTHLIGKYIARSASFAWMGLPALLLGAAAACSSSSNNSSGGPAGGTHGYSYTGGTGNDTGGTSSSSSGGSPNTGLGPTCPGLPYVQSAADACTGTGASVEASKLDVYILMDRTQSMDQSTQNGTSTRWRDLKAAVESFVVNPQVIAQDVHAGIQFFSLTGGFNNSTDCVAANYANPAVEIAPLTQNGQQIITAIEGITPSGETPSIPALQGAVQHAVQWQARHLDRQTIVLLVTDGFPTMCADQTDTSFIAAAAGGLASDPPVRTYVVGVSVGANRFRLQDIATSGGSPQAYLVEDANAQQGLSDALMNITRNPLPCEYPVPPPPTGLLAISYDLVQVTHTNTAGKTEEVPYATTRGGCSDAYGGWYYNIMPPAPNDTTSPKPESIIMCPCTCASFGAGTVNIYLGCHPQITGLN
jgi:hypothetical protein